MPLVAVAPHARVRGLRLPDGDWRDPANAAGIAAEFQITDLGNALAAVYQTDAHLQSCILTRDGAPLTRQPRLTKPTLGWLAHEGFAVACGVLIADLDNPEHAAWQSGAHALIEATRALGILPDAGIYATAHGLRAVQPLTTNLPPDEIEAATRAWYLELEARGLAPDWSCVDWTRHYRLPNVRRAGLAYTSPAMLLDGMRAVPPPAGIARAPRTKHEPAFTGPLRDVDESPLARAFERAGWARARLGRDRRAVVCPWQSEHTSGEEGDSGTIIFGPSPNKPRGWFHCSHGHCAGRRSQRDVIDRLPPNARAFVWASGAADIPEAPVESLADVTARLLATVRKAPEGLSLVRAQCGLGKTRAMRIVAAERAAGALPRSRDTRTAISVPTNALAVQITNDLRAAGASVRRVFGPLSVTDSKGRPVCRFAAVGTALVKGGQSVRAQLCEGRGHACAYRDDCPAVDGSDGPDDARITVGSHGLLGALDAAAGTTGLLAIDEPPPLLDSVTLTAQNLDATIATLPLFAARYAAALAPVMAAVRAFVDLGPLDDPGPLERALELGLVPDLLAAALDATGASDAAGAVCAAQSKDHQGTAPPVLAAWIHEARFNLNLAKRIGDASAILSVVERAIAKPDSSSATRELTRPRPGSEPMPCIIVTSVNGPLENAVRRAGRCLVLAADADLHAPVLHRAVGYAPPLAVFGAPDGAPVQRTLIRSSRANRTTWLPGGKLDGAVLARAIRAAVAWVREERQTGPVALVTYLAAEPAIAAALGQPCEAKWQGDADALAEVVAAIAPELARCPCPIELGHYGGLRGLDRWAGIDTLVTLGDPWPDLGAMAREIQFLDLAADRDARAEAHARAELEQAHGRLRLVHRTRPARLCHVGAVVPGGWPPGHEVRGLPVGQPGGDSETDVRPMVERLGGAARTARALGVAKSTVGRWISGERLPSSEHVAALRQALGSELPERLSREREFLPQGFGQP